MKPDPSEGILRVLPLAAALLFLAAGWAGWIDRPILGPVGARALFFPADASPHISYSSLCWAFAACSLICLAKRTAGLALVAGAAALWVWLYFLVSFALLEPARLVLASDLNQQAGQILSFQKYLPPNAGTPPTFSRELGIDTVYDRLRAAYHFSSLGWYALGFGSLVCFVSFLRGGLRFPKVLSFAFVLFLIAAWGFLALRPYIESQQEFDAAGADLAAGRYARALQRYQIAARLDPNLPHLESYQLALGNCLSLLGKTDEPAHIFHLAHTCLQNKDFQAASLHLETLLSENAPGLPIELLRRSLAWSYVHHGLFQYKSGQPSLAIPLWQKALQADPGQLQSYFFLSRAYSELGSYEESIRAGLRFLAAAKDPIFVANVSANVADAYYRLQAYGPAREFYLKSFLADNYENLRAVMSLVGK
jgi:tetratricopeptide (TPR) repeat protein